MIDVEGLFKSGIYEGLQRISSYYLIFYIEYFITLFLPKLSQHVSKEKTTNFGIRLYKHIIPLFWLRLSGIVFYVGDYCFSFFT